MLQRALTYTLFSLAMYTGCGFTGSGGDANQGDDGNPTPDAMVDGLPPTCETVGETACDGRTRRTCGADLMWDPAQDHVCAYTCAAGACKAPSNLATEDVATCTGMPLTPPAGATVEVTAAGGTHIECDPHCGTPGVTMIDAAATLTPPDPDLTWFCLSAIDLPAGVTITLPATGGPAAAIAFFVDGAATIAGDIAFDGGDAGPGAPGGVGGPGGTDGGDRVSSADGLPGIGSCGGAGGTREGTGGQYGAGGGGGGGNVTTGGRGGDGASSDGSETGAGGSGGAVCPNAALVPLVGGNGGGGGAASTSSDEGWAGGGGGGALQIVSRVAITLTGRIAARGGDGHGNAIEAGGGGGGGSGGGLLLEAPSIDVTAGVLDVDGGGGGTTAAGAGGMGASTNRGPTAGASHASDDQGGAGGGGAGGRIRINAPVAACPPGATPTAACTTGDLDDSAE